MRISTNQFHGQGINSIARHQADLLKIQDTLSTGKRINKPGDDPVAMNQVHALNKSINTIDQFANNGRVAKSQLLLEETSITDVTSALQRARDLALQASNNTYSAQNRKSIAAEITQITEHVKNLMNYTNADGEPLFAGNSTNAEQAYVPDANNPGFFTYVGTANADGTLDSKGNNVYDPQANYGGRMLQIAFDSNNYLNPDDATDASRVRVTDNGARVFSIPNGTTAFTDPTGLALVGTAASPLPESNVLNVLVQMRTELELGNPPSDTIISDFDKAMNNMGLVRAEIGGRQNRIETQFDAGQSFQLSLKERRMLLEETDTVQAISDFTQKQNALQMAQQIFSKVSGMSLFNYFR